MVQIKELERKAGLLAIEMGKAIELCKENAIDLEQRVCDLSLDLLSDEFFDYMINFYKLGMGEFTGDDRTVFWSCAFYPGHFISEYYHCKTREERMGAVLHLHATLGMIGILSEVIDEKYRNGSGHYSVH